jgi:hypothetical protein
VSFFPLTSLILDGEIVAVELEKAAVGA